MAPLKKLRDQVKHPPDGSPENLNEFPQISSPSRKVYQTTSEEEVLTSRGYKLLKQIGEGGYAKIYLSVYTPEEGKGQPISLACKVIDVTTTSQQYAEKFLPRELQIIVKLSHPHIVHIHSVFQRRSKHYIFMRFAERGDLLDFIFKHGAVVEEQAKIWFKQVVSAILYLHKLDIAHRDLKCENLLLSRNYNIKLTDFGFSRLCVNKSGKYVLSETFCGSISYTSPEVISCKPYNPKMSDMWSLGVVLFAMLTKSMPFSETTVTELINSQENRTWKANKMVKDDFSDSLTSLLNSLLEPETTLRWNAEQVARSEWVSGGSTTGVPALDDEVRYEPSKNVSPMLAYLKKKANERLKWMSSKSAKSLRRSKLKAVSN